PGGGARDEPRAHVEQRVLAERTDREQVGAPADPPRGEQPRRAGHAQAERDRHEQRRIRQPAARPEPAEGPHDPQPRHREAPGGQRDAPHAIRPASAARAGGTESHPLPPALAARADAAGSRPLRSALAGRAAVAETGAAMGPGARPARITSPTPAARPPAP